MSIRIETRPLGPLETNCYLLYNDQTKQMLVVDPGMNAEEILADLQGWDVQAILLTHAHFDHIGGVELVRKESSCPVYLHSAELDWLSDPMKNGSGRWPELGGPIVCAPADHELTHGQSLSFLGETFEVRHTPGHSPGSVSFVFGHVVICGDALFYRGVGRTDLPGGNTRTLENSIHKQLFTLDDETLVLPGHGRPTLIADEKRYNPYV
jgi:hydroxyacylglutathione hydrolase